MQIPRRHRIKLFEFQDGDVLITPKFGAASVLADESVLEALRLRLGGTENLATSLRRFVTRAVISDETPVTLLMYRSGVLFAAALLRFRRKLGVLSGIVSAGDGTGQGSVIANDPDRVTVLEIATRVLMRLPLIHTAILTMVWPEPACPGTSQPAPGTQGHWHFRNVGFRLDLTHGREATMEKLGYKMRRNLGYYRRRAETGLGCKFFPELNFHQRRQAVEALANEQPYRMGAHKALKLDAALATMPGHFAMGLQDADGGWLGYLAGWRALDGTYIDWQRNREQPANASLSTVFRSYLLDHELQRQSPALNFVGGTTPNWSRACIPAICGDLLVMRQGWLSQVSQQIVRHFHPSGRLAELQSRAAHPQAAVTSPTKHEVA